MNKWSVGLIIFLAMLTACAPASGSTYPLDATEKPAYPAPPSPTQDLSGFYGHTPSAAILIVGEQKQVAGVGTYTWTLDKKGQEQTSVHADVFALITPVEPLSVPASFTATLRLPIPTAPSELWYALKPVNDSINRMMSSPDMTSWQVTFEQPGTSLDLRPEQELSLSVEPGQYLLKIYADWSELGSVDYGFFLEVQADLASTPQKTLHTQTPTPLIPLRPTWTVTPIGASDLDLARHTLLTFFTLLHDGRYAEAVPLYGGDYETLRIQNPDTPAEDYAALWKASCTHQTPCLLVSKIIKEKSIAQDELEFVVEFVRLDGTLFKLGPCCGETETDMPPVWQFPYTVKKVDGMFKVMEGPVYMP